MENKKLGIKEPSKAESVATQNNSTPRSIIKFKTRFNKITRVEVERDTDTSVWINGRRYSRFTSWEGYFNSFEEAKEALVHEAELKVARLKDSLHRARTELGNVQSLKLSSVPEPNEKQ